MDGRSPVSREPNGASGRQSIWAGQPGPERTVGHGERVGGPAAVPTSTAAASGGSLRPGPRGRRGVRAHWPAQPGGASQVLALEADVITAPLLAAAYGTAGLRLATGGHARVTTSALTPAGRMTLINYLAQPLVGTRMFTNYGTAFVGRVAPVWVAMIALTLFVLRSALRYRHRADRRHRHRARPLVRCAPGLERVVRRLRQRSHTAPHGGRTVQCSTAVGIGPSL
ncbi:DUF418 domain-containing protein [Streptomyces asiaticus]|uniref:DUF418 domain-containing protein n=1 Tax=Streptomyces asiaticus TaxID=114695 RepID=UPI0039BE0D8A